MPANAPDVSATARNRRNKQNGYRLEARAVEYLDAIWAGIQRTGSVNYKKDAADLVAPGVAVQAKYRQSSTIGKLFRALKEAEPEAEYHLVVTQDARQEILVTLTIDDFVRLVTT